MKNNILAGLSVFLFCLALTAFVFCAQIKILASPNFIKSVLSDAKIYDQINNLADELSIDSNDFSYVALIKTFSRSIDKNVAQKEIENFIDNFYAYLLDKAEPGSIKLDLKNVKSNFVAKWPILAPGIFAEEYQKLPVCDATVSSKEAFLSSQKITCKSNEISSSDFSEIIRNANISDFNNSIPDQITLQELINKKDSDLIKIKNFLNYTFKIYNISLIILILSLMGIVVFTFPDYRSIFMKVGWSSFIITLPTVIITYFNSMGSSLMQTIIANPETNKVAAIFAPVIDTFSKNLFSAIIKIPLILCIIGLVLLILALFIPKMESKVLPPGFETKPN